MFDQNIDENRSPYRSLMMVLGIIAIFLVYSFATQATEVNLEEPLDERRQETALRALRALARPDFFTYHEEIRSMDITIRMPCGEEVKGSQTVIGERTAIIAPNCASTTQENIRISGTGFRPRTSGILRWHPPGELATTRALSSFRTDGEGNFSVDLTMPDIRETDEPQLIEVEEKWQTGISGLSEASLTTLDKITETVLLALLATTVGTLLSIPISFIAARNLMVTIGSPLAAIMSGIVAFPIGFFIARAIIRFLLAAGNGLGLSPLIAFILGLGLLGLATYIPQFRIETDTRLISAVKFILALLLGLFAIGLLTDFGLTAGDWLEENLGIFGFVGGFISLISEFLAVFSPGIIGFFAALVAMSFGSRYGQEAVLNQSNATAKIVTAVMTSLGTGVFIYGIARFLNWLYLFDRPFEWTVYPAIAFAVLGLIVGFLIQPKRPIPIGTIIYTTVRGILNLIRSIEPLVYVIIFAVWVGIGPFAGVLALTLHTVAALGKLFSEQVENIAEGPLEAITATGANRIQTIVFAVIPQIIPPYIAFTLYRWDINVRMSTIIGFGGGGGIGFVLAQAINLLQYRQASVMMIAIAIVVGLLDYISSQVRARIL
ncbi:MAG: ABC transporter permease subunit [Anaerolineae bacterium]